MFSYKQSGVDIDAANKAKAEMAKSLTTGNRRVLNKLGAFASLYDFKFPEYRQPVLVFKTEEPGSKQLLAFQHDHLESICFDLVNHLVNDCIVMGAKPLIVQDAIICGKLEPGKVKRLVKALASACQEQDCVLTGGETSEQPKVIPAGTYILTSSLVGLVEKNQIIDGAKIQTGDIVLGLAASGLHTNGYSLVRQLMASHPEIIREQVNGQNFIEEILTPHRCYYQTIKALFPQNIITGLAHITGGGVKENLNRILPKNLSAEIDLTAYQILPIFKLIRKYGKIADAEMIRTFNLGVGLTMAVKPQAVKKVQAEIKAQGVDCYLLGKIKPGQGEVNLINQLKW